MLNYIWMGMLIIGIGYGCFTGSLSEIGQALLESGGSAVTFALGIVGVTALWCGMLEVFQGAGGINAVSVLIRKIVLAVFPQCRNNPEAEKQVVTNIAANFFGLGNGATPSGISAVRELQKVHRGAPDTASPSVCMFLVVNSAAFQLVPTSILAIRTAAGSSNPSSVVVPVWIASAAALVTGVVVYWLYCKIRRHR